MIYEQDPEQMMFMSVEEYREYRFTDRLLGFAVGVIGTIVVAFVILFAVGG